MKLEKELKERFGYVLYDETGESNVFSINEIGDAFIVDHYEKTKKDIVICSIDSSFFEDVNYEDIEYLLCTTALDKYYNCPRVEIFDFNTCEHYTVPMYDYSPFETSLFDEDCKDDYHDRLHDYYKSITDTDADALRLLTNHDVIQQLHREVFYDTEPVEIVTKDAQTERPFPQGQLVFSFEF